MLQAFCLFFSLIVGGANFYFALTAPSQEIWSTVIITGVIFASAFGQFSFKDGEESGLVFMQLLCLSFLFFGTCNLGLIT